MQKTKLICQVEKNANIVLRPQFVVAARDLELPGIALPNTLRPDCAAPSERSVPHLGGGIVQTADCLAQGSTETFFLSSDLSAVWTTTARKFW